MRNIKEMKKTCVSYGYFEGMHKGHIAVIKKTVETAKKKNLTPIIISLTKEGQVLTVEEEKEYFFTNEGIKEVITFSERDMNKSTFVKEVIVEKLGAEVIVIGEKYVDRKKIEEVAKACKITLVICETVKDNGKEITTSLVKEAFDKSDFDKIYRLCGHPYIMIGKVEHGKALGRTVGMPTANLKVSDDKLKPISGVYATSIQIDNKLFKAMASIGKRPSVDDFDYVTIEAFILDFSRDIYGKTVILGVRHFVREIQKFKNLEEVQKQVQKDIETVRSMLEYI